MATPAAIHQNLHDVIVLEEPFKPEKKNDTRVRLRHSNGNVYVGTARGGRMHGKGLLTWADGQTFEGDFVDNKLEGEGKYAWPNGSSYIGQVKDGVRSGEGTLLEAHVTYTGQWKEGLKDGEGTLYFDKDKTSYYKGQWLRDAKHGHGEIVYSSGNIYVGQWVDNVKHGMGRMDWKDRHQRYEGRWKGGQPDGDGSHTWLGDDPASEQPQGHHQQLNRYIGNMEDGARQGTGTFYYANGAMYAGGWDKNAKDGEATVLSGDGVCDTATFRCDTPFEEGSTGQRTMRRKSLCLDPMMNRERVTPVDREAMCDYDSILVGCTSVQRQRVPDLLFRRHDEVDAIYRWYCAQGAADENAACTLSLAQFQLMMRDCRISCRQLPLRSTEKVFEESTGREALSEPVLLLGHFRSALVRLAMWEECGVACMALSEDDCPQGRLEALLDKIKLWACKVVPDSFRELLFRKEIQQIYVRTLEKLLLIHKLAAAASAAKSAKRDIRYEVFRESYTPSELEVKDVLELLQQAGLVAHPTKQESGKINLKKACTLITAPGIDFFDPTTIYELGKPPPEEPKPVKRRASIVQGSRRNSGTTDNLGESRSRRNSVSKSMSRTNSVASKSRRNSISTKSRRNSISSQPPEPVVEEEAAPAEEESLPSGIEAAFRCNAAMPAGTQYNMDTRFTTIEIFESFARVAYVKASEKWNMADDDHDGLLSKEEFLHMQSGTDKVTCEDLKHQLAIVLEKVTLAMQPKIDIYQAALVAERKLALREKELSEGGLTDAQIDQVRYIFKEVDIDLSGTIEKEELLEVCDDKNGKLFDKLDTDGDHHIDVEEFIKYINNMSMKRSQEAAKQLIKHLMACLDKRAARRAADEARYAAAAEAEAAQDE